MSTSSDVAPVTDRSVRPRLVAAPRTALVTVLVAAAGFVTLALWVRDTRTPEPIDTTVAGWLFAHVGPTLRDIMIAVTEPGLTIGTCAVVAVVGLLLRRRDVTVLAVVGPLLGFVLESAVLKPGIDRIIGDVVVQGRLVVPGGYAFPSGHETGVASTALLLALLVARSRWSLAVRAAAFAGCGAWIVVGALALVRSSYHYFTDTVGAILLALVVMLSVALVTDRVGGRLSSPAGRDRSRTVPAA